MALPIAVCTAGSKCLSVFGASAHTYAFDHKLFVHYPKHLTFGEAYNEIMDLLFISHDEILIANDDIVLTPNTISTLLEDVETLKSTVPKLGVVGTWADNVRGLQSIKENPGGQIKRVKALSPILAWISREAFTAARFPPLNWYSDDVICADLAELGYEHYLSRAYVHHVGSSTIGPDDWKNHYDAMPWLKANRPQYVQRWNLKDRGENV